MVRPRLVSDVSWFWFVLRRKTKQKCLFIKRLFVRPKLPGDVGGKVLIHLGCGDIDSPGFINVDARPAPHVHYVLDIHDLSVFRDSYADLIYACHVLEHIDREDVPRVLWEWKRVLRPGGVLRLSVPDFDKLVTLYEACDKNVEIICTPLLGRYEGYRSHVTLFNYKYLEKTLSGLGFSDIRQWAPDAVEYHDFEDWASRGIQWAGREFSISLNVECSKPLKVKG